ncbi:MAG: SDR family NAD(P)-dependent oxidoreductase [Thermodesulfobacteriota bacterium]
MIPEQYFPGFYYALATALVIKLSVLAVVGTYNFSWGLFGLREAIQLGSAILASCAVFGGLMMWLRHWPPFAGFPRSVLLIDFVLTISLLAGLRISKRVAKEVILRRNGNKGRKKKILIVGAGEAGVQVCKEMFHHPKSEYKPVGFIDDDPAKKGLSIQGVSVIGGREKIPEVLEAVEVDDILIAIPSAGSKEIRRIVETIRKSGWKSDVKILPGLLSLFNGKVSITDIEDIQIEDLLGRGKIEVDFGMIRPFVQGKRILITGAGGSIGSELVRTSLRFGPERVVAVDIDETELFNLEQVIGTSNSMFVKVIADIRDEKKISSLFEEVRPQIVIHSAAYKHVPLLEEFPEEAVKTNIHGTKILAEQALAQKVEKFVNISTDKAINPTSVMGASKRAGEEMLRVMNSRGKTKFISVRFGNVLGSRGSVIPLFKQQLKRGGPVTVTHPEMKRYFMAVSEAVLLVLAAAAMGEGGESFVLDMGEPIKIDDLARDMIRLTGKEPDVDIRIVYTGVRPGEKLVEELLGGEEGSETTAVRKIFRARNHKCHDEKELMDKIEKLIRICHERCEKEAILGLLKEIVPTYKPN